MSASLPTRGGLSDGREMNADQADGFRDRPGQDSFLLVMGGLASTSRRADFADTVASTIKFGPHAEECLSHARQQTLFERLEKIVDGIPAAERPGHGLVVTHTVPRLSDAERRLATELLGSSAEVMDNSGDLEIIKFKLSDDPSDTKHCYFVYNPGVFAGLQISLADDGTVRMAGGVADAKAGLEVVTEIEQRLRLRAEMAMLNFHGSVP